MNRKQFIQQLISKSEQSKQFLQVHLNKTMEGISSPSKIKRMQIMQLGCAKIGGNLKKNEQQIRIKTQKKYQSIKDESPQMQNPQIGISNSCNNHKRVFILQKVKYTQQKKRRQTHDRKSVILNNQYERKSSQIMKRQVDNYLNQQRVSSGFIYSNKKLVYEDYPTKQPSKTSANWNSTPKMDMRNYKNKTEDCNNTTKQDSQKICDSQSTQYVIKFQKQNNTTRTETKNFEICENQANNVISQNKASQIYYNNNSSINYLSKINKQAPMFRRKLSIGSMKNQNLKNENRTSGVKRNFQQTKQKQKQEKLTLRQEIRKTYTKKYVAPPKLTSKSYIVLEKQFLNQNSANPQKKTYLPKLILSLNSKSSVQVASLTKIMTCILAIELCQRFQVQAQNQIIKIGKFQSQIGGTSAKIKEGDIYTLHDLLHGLMLPSGNDASLAIAIWGGKIIYGEGDLDQAASSIPHSFTKKTKKQHFYDRFLEQMNSKARQLELTKTNYANSHGLINPMNKSCAYDIGILSMYAMENQYFRSIVSTKKYQKTIQNEQKIKNKVEIIVKKDTIKANQITAQNGENSDKNGIGNEEFSDQSAQSSTQSAEKYAEFSEFLQQDKKQIQYHQQIVKTSRNICWENTHKLIHKAKTPYLGIKTGVTTAAGPCLSSCLRTPCGRQFYIVVLDCKKMLFRFKQTDILRKWVYKQENVVATVKNKRNHSTKSYSCQDNESNDLDEEGENDIEDQQQND